MDLIKNLSKDFVDVLRKKLDIKVQKINVTDLNAAESKDCGIYCEFICINNFTLNNYVLIIVFDEFQKMLKPLYQI